MATKVDLASLARELASRSVGAEANVQAHIQTILLYGGLNLGEDNLQTVELEAQAGGGRRIDIEAGFTVIEVKRDLRLTGVREQAEAQLAGYVRTQTEALGQRYVGVLTDGAEWRLYHLVGQKLAEVSRFELSVAKPDADGLTIWLEGARWRPLSRSSQRRVRSNGDLAHAAQHTRSITPTSRRSTWRARTIRRSS